MSVWKNQRHLQMLQLTGIKNYQGNTAANPPVRAFSHVAPHITLLSSSWNFWKTRGLTSVWIFGANRISKQVSVHSWNYQDTLTQRNPTIHKILKHTELKCQQNFCVDSRHSMGVWGENEIGVVWEAAWSSFIPLSPCSLLLSSGAHKTTPLKIFGNSVQKIKVTDKEQQLFNTPLILMIKNYCIVLCIYPKTFLKENQLYKRHWTLVKHG